MSDAIDQMEQVDEVEVADLAVEEGVEDVLLDQPGEAEPASAEGGDEFPEPQDADWDDSVVVAGGHYNPANESNGAGDVAEQEDEAKPEQGVDDDIAAQIEEATVEVCEAQERAQDKRHKADELTMKAKDAKDAAKAADDDLRDAAKRLRKLREGRFPDGDRYPMFDKDGRKEAVNAMFAKPEAIAPLPPEDFAEHYRRASEKCGLDSLGLKPATLKVLTELGLRTVADYGRKSAAVSEGGADLTSVKGLTEKRADEIADAIEAVAEAWKAEWDAEHPFPEVREIILPEPDEAGEGGDDA
jgi:hypothetical protein